MPNPPLKPKTLEQRPRDFLYPTEITAIVEAACTHSRNPQRDSTLLILMFCHSLQPVEVVFLRWQHVNFAENVEPYLPTLTVYRNRRRGPYQQEFIPDIHFLCPASVKALRRLGNEYKGATWLFPSEHRQPLSTRSLHHIVQQAGKKAGIEFPIHPYMLRISGTLYRAALLHHGFPQLTYQQSYLIWLKHGTLTQLTDEEKEQLQAISQESVSNFFSILSRLQEFLGVTSHHAAKYVLQAMRAYSTPEQLPDDFWLKPPGW